MEHFLETSDTIGKGLGFSHYSLTHIFWLAVFALVAVTASLLYRRLDNEAARTRFRRIFALLIVGDELFKIALLVAGGNYSVSYLPLHLCSINIFLIAAHAVKATATLSHFLYAVDLPGALFALFFPTWTKLPMANFMHIHSFTVHILLATYPILLLASGELKPRARFIPRCLVTLAALAVPVWIFNRIFDTNFMFLMEAKKGNPLYLFEQALGSHLWGFAVLIPAVLAVMFLPPVLFRRLGRKRT